MQKYTVKINSNGTARWYKEGTNILHREDGPAIEFYDGSKQWYQYGQIHREDGPAVEWANGDKHWYVNGEIHRIDGPAVEYADGEKRWFQKGKLHRLDGPAIEYSTGNKAWFIEDKEYTEDEFNTYIGKHICEPMYDGKEVVFEGKKYKLSLVDKK